MPSERNKKVERGRLVSEIRRSPRERTFLEDEIERESYRARHIRESVRERLNNLKERERQRATNLILLSS